VTYCRAYYHHHPTPKTFAALDPPSAVEDDTPVQRVMCAVDVVVVPSTDCNGCTGLLRVEVVDFDADDDAAAADDDAELGDDDDDDCVGHN
jgi:hypothetical protein